MTELKRNLTWAAVFLILIAASVCVIVLRKSMPAAATTARITQDGEVIREIDLESVNEPYEFEIAAPDGGSNTVRVEKGKIGIVKADCPDKICVRRGFVTDGGESAVCLPHRLSVVVLGSDSVDAVSGGM